MTATLHVGSRFRAVAILVALCLAAAPTPAFAVDAQKAAAAMAQKAMRAFETGDHLRAAELYLNAHRMDRTQTAWLYNAARANHIAGKLEQAETLYREFLVNPTGDPAFAGKARGYLQAIALRRADDKADEAGQAARKDQHAAAARVWHAAFKLAPERRNYLLRAARAEHLAGDREAAQRDYNEWLALADDRDPERAEAKAWLDELLAPPLVQPVAAPLLPDAPKLPVVTVPAPPPPQRWPAWTALGSGAVLAGVAGVVWLRARTDHDTLDKELAETNGQGFISGVGHLEARSRASQLETRYTAAAVIGSVGLAAVATGVGLLLRKRTAPAELALSPLSVTVTGFLPGTPAGAAVAVRF